MSSSEEEEEEVGLSFNEEKKMEVKKMMNNLMQSLVTSTDPTNSIGQLLLKEPEMESELSHQAWKDGIGIKMCLVILEQVLILFSNI